jgi:hypothetical protein
MLIEDCDLQGPPQLNEPQIGDGNSRQYLRSKYLKTARRKVLVGVELGRSFKPDRCSHFLYGVGENDRTTHRVECFYDVSYAFIIGAVFFSFAF